MKKSTCCNSKVIKQNDSLFCSHCISILDKSQVKRNSKLFYVFLLILIAIFFLTRANAPTTKIQLNGWKYSIGVPLFHDVELNDSAITAELVANGCIIPSVAIAQAHIESDFYRSKKTFDNKNIFGIKPHKCKYVIGKNRFQAVYGSYKDCIACYCHIQKLYLKNIDGHYATNSAYVDLIKKVK